MNHVINDPNPHYPSPQLFIFGWLTVLLELSNLNTLNCLHTAVLDNGGSTVGITYVQKTMNHEDRKVHKS